MAKEAEKETPYMSDGSVRLIAKMTTGELMSIHVHLGPRGEPVAVDIGPVRLGVEEFAKVAAKVAALRVVDK
jgi:hypothetical protein